MSNCNFLSPKIHYSYAYLPLLRNLSYPTHPYQTTRGILPFFSSTLRPCQLPKPSKVIGQEPDIALQACHTNPRQNMTIERKRNERLVLGLEGHDYMLVTFFLFASLFQ